MLNFDFICPTKIIFGKGSIKKLENLIPKDKKIMLIYGGGSIKKNGVYNQVRDALRAHKFTEFSGIEANPKFETCMQAVEFAKVEKVDFLLAIGGGSTLDATKFIASAINYKGEDAYEIVKQEIQVQDLFPIGAVMTLPATGSEMNCGCVISRESTQEKFAVRNEKLFPQFSLIDPESTYTLPINQMRNGIVDTFVHVMELYATIDVNTPLQDFWALGIIKTLMQEAPIAFENPKDYDTRANLCWCATCGLNYWLALGCVQDWATHRIGHDLTALYGLSHGESLAVILPLLWESQKDIKKAKLATMAREVFNCNDSNDDLAAEYCIKMTEAFFNSIGMKTKLRDYGINAKEAAEKISKRFEERGTLLGEKLQVNFETIKDIILKSQ